MTSPSSPTSPFVIIHSVYVSVGPGFTMHDYDAAHAVMRNVPDDVVVYVPSLNRTIPRVGGNVFVALHLKHAIMYKTEVVATVEYPKITYIPKPKERRQQRVPFHKRVPDGPHFCLVEYGVGDDCLAMEMPVGSILTEKATDTLMPDVPHATDPSLCVALLQRWNVYKVVLGDAAVCLDLHSTGLRVSY